MKHSVLEQALRAMEASDKRIVQLLTLRRQLTAQLSQAAPEQEGARTPEERLTTLMSRLVRVNPGPLDHQQVASLFETVIRLTEPLCGTISAGNGAAKKG